MSGVSDPAMNANQLPISIEFPREEERFYEILSLWQKRVSSAVNSKNGGLHTLIETFSFKQYFTPGDPNVFRNVYRKCFDMVALNGGGSIGAGATVSFAHNITGLLFAGDIKADCTGNTPTKYFSEMGPNSVWLDATNVNFKNDSGSILTSVIVIAEYLKN